MIGGLAGWYVFLRGEIQNTESLDAERGIDTSPGFGGPVGNTYQNVLTELTGGESIAAATGKESPRLWQVTKSPVAGFAFGTSTAIVQFAERSSGNILRADPKTSVIERLTNTLFAKTYEASFGQGGVVLRSVEGEVVTTFAGTIAAITPSTHATATPLTLEGVYLPQNIVDVAPRGTQIAFIVENPAGGSVIATADWTGGAQKKITELPLVQWHLSWLDDGRMIVAQRAADGIPGSAFTVSSAGTLARLVDEAPGLTVLPKSGSGALIYGTSAFGDLALLVQASADASPVRLSIRTTADKCVWVPGQALIAYCAVPQVLPSGSYLAERYQGAMHTTDAWWKVDVSAGTAEKFFTTDSSLALDVANPVMDASGSYIAFRNAADQSLWLLRVQQ